MFTEEDLQKSYEVRLLKAPSLKNARKAYESNCTKKLYLYGVILEKKGMSQTAKIRRFPCVVGHLSVDVRGDGSMTIFGLTRIPGIKDYWECCAFICFRDLEESCHGLLTIKVIVDK